MQALRLTWKQIIVAMQIKLPVRMQAIFAFKWAIINVNYVFSGPKCSNMYNLHKAIKGYLNCMQYGLTSVFCYCTACRERLEPTSILIISPPPALYSR
jgi:hypothetical protein